MTEIEDTARARKTLKLLGDLSRLLPTDGLDRATVEAMIAAAGWAPFHRPTHSAREGDDPVCEPWRVAMLDAAACRTLLARLGEITERPGKLADMLAAADALLLVTWKPEPSSGGWEATEFNQEHIAAGAAFIQTLLLAATARGIGNYWSSGGALGSDAAFRMLGIDTEDVLLGAVFLFPNPPSEGTTPLPGKLRARRSPPQAWSRWTQPG